MNFFKDKTIRKIIFVTYTFYKDKTLIQKMTASILKGKKPARKI